MNSKRLSLLVVVGLALLISVTWTAQHDRMFAAESVVRRWEHLAITVDAAQGIGNAKTSQQIVRVGNEGWELVSLATLQQDGTTTKLVYCFKRPK